MVYSLFCARDILLSGKTIIVVYADIIYEPNLLAAILTNNADIATVIDLEWHALWTARFENPLEDAETLRLSADGHLVEIGQVPSSLEEIEGQYIGLTKFSAAGALAFEAVYRDISKYVPGKTMHNCYFTDVLQGLVERGDVIDTVSVRGGWLEFDSPSDCALYEKVSGQDSEHKFFDIGWR